jgi:hypothetical protein
MVDAGNGAGPAWLEWFTRGAALRQARDGGPSPELADVLRRVDGFLELVELGLEPPEAFAAGDPNDALLFLLAEAFRLAGATLAALGRDASVTEVAAALGAERLSAFVPADTTLENVVTWLGTGRAVAMSDLSVPEADERLAQCRAFVRAFVAHAGSARTAIAALESQRRSRPLAVAVVVLGLAVLGVVGGRRLFAAPDLAAGKTFTASSAYTGFQTSGIVNVPIEYDVFLHTREEESPWVRLDLGTVETFRTVEIVNRPDCCRERATPLVVEASEDGDTWKEIGRRADEFTEWSLGLNPTKARYVRLSVPRRTYLHLARISVRR